MSGLPKLPPNNSIETIAVLRKAAEAHRYLAELKGVLVVLPNPEILIDTLALQEARESSAIENIISTYTDIYQSDQKSESYISPGSKEVHAYANALRKGFDLIRQNQLLTNNHILEIQALLEKIKQVGENYPGQFCAMKLPGKLFTLHPRNMIPLLC